MSADAIRVVFDHRIFSSQVHGGISRYFARIASALPPFGVKPRIVAPLYVNAYLGDVSREIVTGCRLSTQQPNAVMWAQRADTALSAPLTRLFRADIVHETYYAARRTAPAGVKVALTVYDMIHELYPSQFSDPTIEYKKRSVREADLIFCISESTRRDLIRFYPEVADRTVVTLLGIDPPSSANDDKVGLGGGERPFILYVGLRERYKNFATLLEAFAQSSRLRSDFDLVCVGGGGFSESESKAIEDAELCDKVRQTNANDRELQKLYRSAALFVYPSLYEGFGLPPLEAMAQGCPVAVSNTSSIPEVCGDAAEYFDPTSAGSIAGAVERALYDSGRSDDLRALGAERLTHFSWARCAEATAAGYRRMLS